MKVYRVYLVGSGRNTHRIVLADSESEACGFVAEHIHPNDRNMKVSMMWMLVAEEVKLDIHGETETTWWEPKRSDGL